MIDVFVAFDATDHEPDSSDPSNVVRLLDLLKVYPLYEPGVGTRLGHFRRAGSVLGIGGVDRIDDQLDRLSLKFFDQKRVSVVGGSRGAAAARCFTHAYAERFPDRLPIYLCILFDHVQADGWGAAKRIGPRRLWSVGEYAAPYCHRSLHLRATGNSHRFYLSDHVETDQVIEFPDFKHTQALHRREPLLAARGFAKNHGIDIL